MYIDLSSRLADTACLLLPERPIRSIAHWAGERVSVCVWLCLFLMQIFAIRIDYTTVVRSINIEQFTFAIRAWTISEKHTNTHTHGPPARTRLSLRRAAHEKKKMINNNLSIKMVKHWPSKHMTATATTTE